MKSLILIALSMILGLSVSAASPRTSNAPPALHLPLSKSLFIEQIGHLRLIPARSRAAYITVASDGDFAEEDKAIVVSRPNIADYGMLTLGNFVWCLQHLPKQVVVERFDEGYGVHVLQTTNPAGETTEFWFQIAGPHALLREIWLGNGQHSSEFGEIDIFVALILRTCQKAPGNPIK